MKFELLPNEILIECFEYLNTFDIFYSFDKLNFRFNKLIENIPLKLNFECVRKEIFDKFCTKLLLNSELKKQIKTLQLSNDGTCGQIETFLSYFSLNEFSSLQSLTLIQLTINDLKKLKSMITSELRYVYFIDPNPALENNLSLISIYKNQSSYRHLFPLFESCFLTHLTLHYYTCAGLSRMFEYVPMLKYLNVRTECEYENYLKDNYQNWGNCNVIHLTHFIIKDFKENFANFEILMKHIPNLKFLSIISKKDNEIIDAPRWEHLITSLLSQLRIFKFHFSIENARRELDILRDKFEQFQSNFWQEQHHWCTEYSLLPESQIYTISCPSFPTHSYCSPIKSINLKIFNYVKMLFISPSLKEKCENYYPNIIDLRIGDIWRNQNDKSLSGKEYFQYIKMSINLSNVKHLDIHAMNKHQLLVLLLLIFKETPKLSSITIEAETFLLLSKNRELRKYINKKIRKLNLLNFGDLFQIDDSIEEFYKMLSNIEQFKCESIASYQLLYLLQRLPKLSIIKVDSDSLSYELDLLSIENELCKLNALYSIEYGNEEPELLDINIERTKLTIWINNNN